MICVCVDLSLLFTLFYVSLVFLAATCSWSGIFLGHNGFTIRLHSPLRNLSLHVSNWQNISSCISFVYFIQSWADKVFSVVTSSQVSVMLNSDIPPVIYRIFWLHALWHFRECCNEHKGFCASLEVVHCLQGPAARCLTQTKTKFQKK